MIRDTGAAGPVSDYREFPPPLSLARHFLCLWTQAIEGSRDPFPQRVVPDGCVDIVLINNEAPVVIGPWIEPFVASLAPGTIIVGARCHPGAAPSVLGFPAEALLNQSVRLSAVWRAAVSARFDQIVDARDLSARRKAMEAALLEHLCQAGPLDQTMNAAIRWLAGHPHGRIKELARWIGVSSRQLQRRFTAAVGYGPKMFQSVLRFQRLLNLSAGSRAPLNLAQLSADSGYADQSHMTREVLRFSGNTPTVFVRSARCALRMSDLFNPTVDEVP